MESWALLIGATLNAGTVLAIAALGLLINEKAGIVNLGAEGMMLCAAIAGFAAVVHTGSPWLGFAAGMLAGAVLAAMFGWLVIWLGTNQYATGLALSLFGVGFSAFVGIGYVQARLPELPKFTLPWLRDLPPARRYGVMVVASDANWAQAMHAFARGERGLGLLLGGGLALWLFWVAGTWLGTQAGGLLADPRRWGLDMVMGCFLLAMAVGGPKSPRVLAIWAVAAGGSLLAHRWLPEHTHVVAGALAGGLAGLAWPEQTHDA